MKHSYIKIDYNDLNDLVKDIFLCEKVEELNAKTIAEVLVTADAQGISSHGVSRTQRYINDIKKGLTHPNTLHKVEKSSPTLEVWDGCKGLGAVLSCKAMNKATQLAQKNGIGIVSVHSSSHHGISSYYTHKALEHNMIGIAMTNTAPLSVPTGGTETRLGTNPLAFAAPTSGKLPPFILDMATTNVTRGAVEIKLRNKERIPEGWAIDKYGKTPSNAQQFLSDLLNLEGGLLPLGGESTGHKGYGLAMMVEILTALLSGGEYGINVRDTKDTAASVSHFFMAINIENFQPIDKFKTSMDNYLTTMLETKRKNPLIPIYYAGQIPYENLQKSKIHGVPLLPSVYEELISIAKHYHVKIPSIVS